MAHSNSNKSYYKTNENTKHKENNKNKAYLPCYESFKSIFNKFIFGRRAKKRNIKGNKRTNFKRNLICIIFLLIILVGSVLIYFLLENSNNSNSKNTSSPDNNLPPPTNDTDFIITIENTISLDSHNQEIKSLVNNSEPVKVHNRPWLYSQLGIFGSNLSDICENFVKELDSHLELKIILAYKFKDNIINEKSALVLGTYIDISFTYVFLEAIKKIKALISEQTLNDSQTETINLLLRMEIHANYEQYVMDYNPYFIFVERSTREQLFEYINTFKKWDKLSFLYIKLNLSILEKGNKWYNRTVDGNELDFYTVKDVELLKYQCVIFSLPVLSRFFVIKSNGNVVKWRILDEEHLNEISEKNNLGFIEKEKRVIMEKAEKMLEILVTENEKYNITKLQKLFVGFLQGLENIKEKLKLLDVDAWDG